MSKIIRDEYKEDWYMYGYRILMLIHRQKDGGENNGDHKSIRRISTGYEDYNKCFDELHQILISSPLPYRIYSSVNARNFDKACRNFRMKQIDIENHDEKERLKFYSGADKVFKSCMAQPACRETNHFLVDLDMDSRFALWEVEDQLARFTKVLDVRKTKNGHHLITEPFNPNLVPELEIKKDAMLLVDWE